jgi:HEAT repeat protein
MMANKPQRSTDIAELGDALDALGTATSRDHYHELLGDLKPLVVTNLDAIAELFDNVDFPRFPVLWSLIGVTSSDAISLMSRGIADPDKYVRWAASEALAKCDTPESTDALVNALRDRSSLVKGVAVTAMKRLRPLPALPQLRKIAASRFQQTHSPGTVSAALTAIDLIENGGEPSDARESPS